MTINEAKEFLKKNGYKILKEDVNSDEAPAWEEGWKALSFNEKKAARWLMQNFNKDNKINEEDLEKSLDVIIIEAILDHKKEWIEFMTVRLLLKFNGNNDNFTVVGGIIK